MYKYYATQSMYKELSMTSCMEHVHVTWKLHATNSFPKGRSDRTSSRKGPAKYDSSKQPLNPLRILFGRLREVRLLKEFEKPQKSRKMMHAN